MQVRFVTPLSFFFAEYLIMDDPDCTWVLLSTTQVALWKNRIPDFIYKRIKQKCSLRNNEEVRGLRRDNYELIESFRFLYGHSLERCEYATLTNMPTVYKDAYKIAQIPIYGNALSPESIELYIKCPHAFFLQMYQSLPESTYLQKYQGLRCRMRTPNLIEL